MSLVRAHHLGPSDPEKWKRPGVRRSSRTHLGLIKGISLNLPTEAPPCGSFSQCCQSFFPRIAAVQRVEVGIFSSINCRKSDIIFHPYLQGLQHHATPFCRLNVIGISPPSGVQQKCLPNDSCNQMLPPLLSGVRWGRKAASVSKRELTFRRQERLAEPKGLRRAQKWKAIRNAEQICISRASWLTFSLQVALLLCLSSLTSCAPGPLQGLWQLQSSVLTTQSFSQPLCVTEEGWPRMVRQVPPCARAPEQ